MTNTDRPDTAVRRLGRMAVPLSLAVLGAALVLLMLVLVTHGGGAHILKGILGKQVKGGAGGLREVVNAVDQLKGPAAALLGSVSTVGVIAGGVLMAMGNRHGLTFMATSGGAAVVVLIGIGIAE